MPKNQKMPRTKKYRRDRNHAEFLENIGFSGIIVKSPIILVYDPPDKGGIFYMFAVLFLLFAGYESCYREENGDSVNSEIV